MNAKRITALALALVMTLLLAACGSKTVVNDDGTKTEQTERGVKVTQTVAKAVQTEKYETADFSMTIPKGWTVTTGGTNIYHSIRVSDPNEPLNQMFVLLKADVLLHSQAGKDAWQQNYNMGDTQAALFAKAAVLDNPSTEGFFRIFSQYTAFASEVEPAYSGYAFPRFDNFTVTDRYPSASPMKSSALGDEQLRATFTDNGKEGEGLFAASVVDFGSFAISNGNVVGYQLQAVDGGYYMAYNIVAVTAAKDTFIEWEGVLTDCFKTLQYSDSFVSTTNQASNEKVALAQQISQNFNATMDGFMSSWESRNRSQDIMSQKQSDATLGYERVYDTETGEIYKATNGFTDVYDGKRYKAVTDDNMYAEPIFGSNLAGSVQGWRDSLGGWVDSTFGKGEEIMEKLNAEDLHLGRFEYGAAFDMGYEFGQGVEDTVGGLFDFSAMDSLGAADGLDAFNLGNTLDGIYGNTGDTAGNTAAMSDALDIAEEDLAYMRDIAEREAINRFTTAEIKVEQHNENHISKDTDLDGIMDAWANDFAEKLDVSEEGVHE